MSLNYGDITMTTNELTIEDIKKQAARLKEHFASQNTPISHSNALEALAKQHGYKDWNVLSAKLKHGKNTPNWPTLDDKISGTYLGHPFTGTVLKTNVSNLPHVRRYKIHFDDPIDVVTSELFSNYRQRINCFLNEDMHSTNHKGERDNLLHITS